MKTAQFTGDLFVLLLNAIAVAIFFSAAML